MFLNTSQSHKIFIYYSLSFYTVNWSWTLLQSVENKANIFYSSSIRNVDNIQKKYKIQCVLMSQDKIKE